ncbi:MAG: phosphoribosylanthranilate isomerase [Alteromonadaceae bacterium]|nr:MAG: phosphoribosylanthranilate isomerase [Alteromonadaceae bacterium]
MPSTRIKICGITRPEDAELAAALGADAIGMVFYEPSPRHVTDLGLAREIADAAGPFTTVVALTVNMVFRELDKVLNKVPVNLLQFHGDENEKICRQFQRPYIKAIRMRPGVDLEAEITAFESSSGILLDTYVKGIPGGTGEAFNWHSVPQNTAKPIILAGGLHADNVAEGIRVAKPYAVDVSGGVEAEKRIKDSAKLRAFIANAKAS